MCPCEVMGVQACAVSDFRGKQEADDDSFGV